MQRGQIVGLQGWMQVTDVRQVEISLGEAGLGLQLGLQLITGLIVDWLFSIEKISRLIVLGNIQL